MNLFWWVIVAAWLCLVFAFTELAIERWTTGVDRSWAAFHGSHPMFIFIILGLCGWGASHLWLLAAAASLGKARRFRKPELLRVALLLLPTLVLDMAPFVGRR